MCITKFDLNIKLNLFLIFFAILVVNLVSYHSPYLSPYISISPIFHKINVMNVNHTLCSVRYNIWGYHIPYICMWVLCCVFPAWVYMDVYMEISYATSHICELCLKETSLLVKILSFLMKHDECDEY